MDIDISFPGGKRVDARLNNFVVHTDQPRESGGEDSAPGPFELFLASIGTCAGIYVVGFCDARGLSTDGIVLRQHVDIDPATHLPTAITLRLELPESFPEKYVSAITRAAENCKVKKTIAAAPSITIDTHRKESANVSSSNL